MPLFTISVQDLLDENFDFGLGPEDYSIFDEEYRPLLNKKIIDHYRDYEIGQETEEKFRFYLNRRMNEQMPIYNQFYLSTRIQFDPLQTMNYTDFTNTTDNHTRTGTNSTTGSGESTSGSRNVVSDTPQVQLSGNEDYASSANDANATVNTSQNSSANSSDTDSATASIERTLNGSQGLPAADLLMRYRATFLNIDMMVINTLQNLFMQVWDNGDEFSATDRTTGYGFPGIGWFGII